MPEKRIDKHQKGLYICNELTQTSRYEHQPFIIQPLKSAATQPAKAVQLPV
jgi:hypothetical protein